MYIYILDYCTSRIYKDEIPDKYVNEEGDVDVLQFMADNDLDENSCSWMLTDEELELESLND